VLCIIQLVCTLMLTSIYSRMIRRLSIPLPLKSHTVTLRRLTSPPSKLFAGIVIVTLFTLLILPLTALAVRSITRIEPDRGATTVNSPGFTLDFYRALFTNPTASVFYAPPTTAIAVSMVYALATMFLALILGIPAAIALSRDGSTPINRGLDALLMLPLGTSAVTLGLGFIVALDKPPLDLRASLLLVPLAHTLVAFPFVEGTSLQPCAASARASARQQLY